MICILVHTYPNLIKLVRNWWVSLLQSILFWLFILLYCSKRSHYLFIFYIFTNKYVNVSLYKEVQQAMQNRHWFICLGIKWCINRHIMIFYVLYLPVTAPISEQTNLHQDNMLMSLFNSSFSFFDNFYLSSKWFIIWYIIIFCSFTKKCQYH